MNFTKEYLHMKYWYFLFFSSFLSVFFLFCNADCEPLKIFLWVARREVYSLETVLRWIYVASVLDTPGAPPDIFLAHVYTPVITAASSCTRI